MRVTESQTRRTLVSQITTNRLNVDKYSNQVTTGLSVQEPGDSKQSGTISRFNESYNRNESHIQRISMVKSLLEYQEGIVTSLSDYVIRAKELAAQGANETYGVEKRRALASEVFAMRDSVVSLANSKYQGVYIYGSADDDDPPYDRVADYVPASNGLADERYAFDKEAGTDVVKQVVITDSLTINVSTRGDKIFDNLITSLERLGRTLSGYKTDVDADGKSLGTGDPYDFENDYKNAYTQQTEDIRKCLDLVNKSSTEDILPEQASLAGRLTRLDISKSILNITNTSTKEALSTLQEVDAYEAASNLVNAQTALNASFLVTSRILRLSFLDYI
ncbi:MAG: flagellin [Bdellovibrionota bacterium]